MSRKISTKAIVGYKGFHTTEKGRPYCAPGGTTKYYKMGLNTDTRRPLLCNYGIHFCERPFNVFKFYSPTDVTSGKDQTAFAILRVEKGIEIDKDRVKTAAKEVVIEEFLTVGEYIQRFGKKMTKKHIRWPKSLTCRPVGYKEQAPIFSGFKILVKYDSDNYEYVFIDEEKDKKIHPGLKVVGVVLPRKEFHGILSGEVYLMADKLWLVVDTVREYVLTPGLPNTFPYLQKIVTK